MINGVRVVINEDLGWSRLECSMDSMEMRVRGLELSLNGG
jgi:hypothetical protein